MTDKYRDALLTVIERYIRVKSSVSSDGGRLRADVTLSHAMTDLENAAIQEEREAIVSFLREQDHKAFSQWIESAAKKYNNNLAWAASQIENGEHLK